VHVLLVEKNTNFDRLEDWFIHLYYNISRTNALNSNWNEIYPLIQGISFLGFVFERESYLRSVSLVMVELL
jgi:hypothetical protein